MKETELELLRTGRNPEVDLLQPEELESVLGGAKRCDQGYSHSFLKGTKCNCGYNSDYQQPLSSTNEETARVPL